MASASNAKSGISVAGIVNDVDKQVRVIPESRRADGSIRKERRVKPGFTPAEDVSRFIPSRVLRAQEEAARSGRSIPGSELHSMESARRTLAQMSVSDKVIASQNQAIPARSDATSWRRGPPQRSVNASSNGNWRSSAEADLKSSKNSVGREVREVKKAVEASIPDDWDAEAPSPNPEVESSKDHHSEIVKQPLSSEGKSEGSLVPVKEPQKEEDSKPVDIIDDPIASLTDNIESLNVSKDRSPSQKRA